MFLLFLFLSFCHFSVDLMLGIWPLYKTMAGIDLAKAGIVVGIGAFLGEGSQLLFGSLSDKGYRKALIVIGTLIASANAFIGLTTETSLLFLCYLLTCIGSGCFHPAASSLANSIVPEKRGLLMGVFGAAGSLGLGLSQLIFLFTYQHFEGNTIPLALLALLSSFGLLFLAFPKKETKKTALLPIKTLVSLFKNRGLRTLYFLQVASQSILWGAVFILPDVLKAYGHSEVVAFGLGHLVFLLGGGMMMIPMGYLSDIFSGRQVLLAATVSGFCSFYLFIFFGAYSAPLALLLLFVTGASMGIINPVGVSFGTRLEPNAPGAVSALLMGLVWCISEGIGPGGVGLLSTLFDDAYAPVKAFALLGSLFIIQLFGAFALPKHVPAEAEGIA